MIYKNEFLNEISFPLGGIGTGSIGLCGNGSFMDWEIFNRPNKGSSNPFTFFALRAEFPDGKTDIRVLQGDKTSYLSGQYSQRWFNGFGYGPDGDTMCAFPHFKNIVFNGSFPVATISFSDELFPAEIILEAFNPFIPHDAKNSSIPVALFNIKVKSKVNGVKYTLVFSAKNPFNKTLNKDTSYNGISSVTMKYADVPVTDINYGDITIATNDENGFTQVNWYRGMWRDHIATFWSELIDDNIHQRLYNDAGNGDIGTVATRFTLNSGEEKTTLFSITWNIPNCHNYWSEYKDINVKEILWKNYYATVFENSLDSTKYVYENYCYLYDKTLKFRNSLHSSTLDPVIIDAISSTLSVLKSPTVLRLEDGTFYGWEGVHEKAGSCEGTCTHVWSYAYALCFLFPELERSLRNTEFNYDTDKDGRMQFRTALPLGVVQNNFRACLDGQMASIIKSYREWKISGDNNWLKENWKTIKLLMEYAWSKNNPDKWDIDMDGILEGRQHHTLDMELFGPCGWLQGMYLAALKACTVMADFMDDAELACKCRTLFDKGYEYTKNELFNGKYYIQKIDISNKSFTREFNCPEYWNEEKQQLKYQIANGCEIDQLLGQWHASICGLGDIFDPTQRKIALKNMYNHLFKPSMRNFPNAWRVFVLNDEAGTIMCDYPSDITRPVIPIPYSDECMTGFEYAFAGLLISEGFTDEGLNVIKGIRNRYDGKKRNPYNEIECGSNYARPMASFALIPIFSGLEFDLPNHHIGFSPIINGDFKTIFSLGNVWGNYIRTETSIRLEIESGILELTSIKLGGVNNISHIFVDGTEITFIQTNDIIHFTKSYISNKIEFIIQ